jgi:hypothetical protein
MPAFGLEGGSITLQKPTLCLAIGGDVLVFLKAGEEGGEEGGRREEEEERSCCLLWTLAGRIICLVTSGNVLALQG